jgi:integrase
VRAGRRAPFEPDSFTSGFRRIARAVGLEGVRLHDLRHAVATRLAASGLPPSETSRILGHASAAFTMATYTHSDAASAERARRAIETVFEGR